MFFLGKPFFVTKERFPQAPSKKVVLDIDGVIRAS